MVAIRVGESECATEWALDRWRDYCVTAGYKSIVNALDTGGMEPDSGAYAGLGSRGKIGTGNYFPQCEGDRRGLKNDSMRRACLGSHKSEVLLVKRLGCVEVEGLDGNKIGSSDGHGNAPSFRVSLLTRNNLCQNVDMSQEGNSVHLETSLGYLLKEASSTLRSAMEAVLRPLGMTVTHYACLELLAQRPGLSNSDLARGTFVTRQSMNVLLKALEQDGCVIRPAEATVGKVLPTRLTPRGRRSLETASIAVRSVEARMLGRMTRDEQLSAFRILQSMVHSLREDNEGA